MKFTQANIEKLVKKWQKYLRLQDWDIRVVLHNQFECVAEIHQKTNSREAVLNIREAPLASKRTGAWMPTDDDYEISIVHELLHLQFWITVEEFYGKKKATREMEKAVDTMAKVLVNLKRNG